MAGNETWRPLGELAFVGMTLVAAIVVGYLAGSYLDRKLNSEPVGLITGVVLGSAAGFLNLWRTVKKLR